MNTPNRLKQLLEAIVIGAIVIATIGGAVLLSGPQTSARSAPIVTPSPIVPTTPTAISTPIVTAAPTIIGNVIAPTITPSATATSTPSATSTPTVCPPPIGWQPYTVGSFDTLFLIAQRFNIDPNSLARANCLSGYAITVGQTIYVPSTLPTSTPMPCYPPYNWVIYIVRPGDTLTGIAVRYNISVYQLEQANCLSTTFIYVGQVLRVPPIIFYPTATPTFMPSATPTGTDTPTPSITSSPTSTVVTPPTAPSPTDTPTPSATPITPAPTITSTLASPTPTVTDTPLPTSTSTTTPPSATPTDTATSIPPTDTPTSIPTSAPTIAATSVITP